MSDGKPDTQPRGRGLESAVELGYSATVADDPDPRSYRHFEAERVLVLNEPTLEPFAPRTATPPLRSDRDPIEWLAWLGSLLSLLVFVRFCSNGFWGDDWELLSEAVRGAGPIDPVASHLRPLVRLHFLLAHHSVSPLLFHVLSLVLHLGAAGCLFLFARTLYGDRTARLAALLFAAAFPANEAIYWASAVGVVYCAIFSLLAIRFWWIDRPVLAALVLTLAALSYELWLLVLPVFLLKRARLRHWLFPASLLCVFGAVTLLMFGWSGARDYGGYDFAAMPGRWATYALELLSPTTALPGVLPSIAVLALLAALVFMGRPFRLPLLLYVGSAGILSLSEFTPSRFHYFPQLALVLVIALLRGGERVRSWIGAALAVYLLGSSTLFNHLDGLDYRRLSDLNAETMALGARVLASAAPGDSYVLVNRTTPRRLIEIITTPRGRDKSLFVRGEGVNGVIYLRDLATLALRPRGLAPVEQACRGTMVEFGDGAPVANYCFGVVRLRDTARSGEATGTALSPTGMFASWRGGPVTPQRRRSVRPGAASRRAAPRGLRSDSRSQQVDQE